MKSRKMNIGSKTKWRKVVKGTPSKSDLEQFLQELKHMESQEEELFI